MCPEGLEKRLENIEIILKDLLNRNTYSPTGKE